jgi:cytochrome c-type biogenesis protein CcmF
VATLVLLVSKQQVKMAMVCAHFGVGIMILGMTISSYKEHESLHAISVGGDVFEGPYHLVLDQIENIDGPNYKAQKATFLVHKKNQQVAVLQPEKRFYWTQQILHGETAIYHDGLDDLYLALGEEYKDAIWSIRLYHKPGINLLWIGGVFVVLGILIPLLRRCSNRKEHQVALVLLVILNMNSAVAMNAHEKMLDQGLETRAQFLYKSLRCPTCGGQTLNDSPSEVSEKMREDIRQGLQEGRSNQEIVQGMKARYGDSITDLSVCEGEGFLLTLIPWLILGGVCFILFRLFV